MQVSSAAMQRRVPASRAPGFTLIELMITVAIVAALAAIAIPSYRNYNMKANRSSAQTLMLAIQNREEQYILDARQYTAALDSTGLNMTQEGWTCTAASCTNKFYTVTVAAPGGTPPTYTISGVPNAATYQATDGTLTLTNTGAKTRGSTSGW